jgi:hypothetical protein
MRSVDSHFDGHIFDGVILTDLDGLYVQLDERISTVFSEYSTEKIDEFFDNMCLIVEYH